MSSTLKVSKTAAVRMFDLMGWKKVDKWSDKRISDRLNGFDKVTDGKQKVYKGGPEDPKKELDKDANKLMADILQAIKDEKEIVLVDDKKAKAEDKTKKSKEKKGKEKAEKPKKGKKAKDDEDEDEEEEEPEEEDEDEEEDEEESDGEEDEEEDDDDEDDEEEDEKPAKKGKKASKKSKDEEEDDDDEDDEEEEDEDEEDDDEEDEEKPKKKAKKAKGKGKKEGAFAKVGVIDKMRELLQAASKKEPITLKKVHKILTKKFPDRDPDGMMVTIRDQIYRQLAKRGFKVFKDGEGGYWVRKEKKDD